MSIYSKNILNKAKENEAWSKIFQFVKPNSKILDIGCSSGKLGAALRKEKGAYVVGMDLDEDDVKLAKKNLNEAFLLNIEQDSIKHLGKFDIVVMADVIEHLLDPINALKKIKGALRPNGELIFSIPNMANATVRIELLKGRFEYRDWGLLDRTHLHFYDQEEVNRVFREANYNVLKTDCTIRNIPKNVLIKELKPLGIEVTDSFVDFLNRPEALTYQFVGRATPDVTLKKFTAQSTSSLDSVTREIDGILQQLSAKEQSIQMLNKQLKEMEVRANTLDVELQGIHRSKGWRLLKRTYQARDTFLKPIKKHKNK